MKISRRLRKAASPIKKGRYQLLKTEKNMFGRTLPKGEQFEVVGFKIKERVGLEDVWTVQLALCKLSRGPVLPVDVNVLSDAIGRGALTYLG